MEWCPERLIGAVCLLLPGAAFGVSTWQVGNQASFYQGDYGTSHTIDIFYDATFISYHHDRLKLKLSMPYEAVSGLPEGGTVTGGGSVANGRKSTTTHSASGLGDIWLSGRYEVVPLTSRHPGFDAYSKVKLATASHSDGLGTGHNDYEFGVGVNGYIAPSGYPFADLGYRFVGSPSNLSLNNIITYDAGYSYQATQRNVLTAMFTGHQAEQSGESAPADLLFAWDYRVSGAGGLQLFVDKGLTNSSPDYGVGGGAHLNF